MKANIEKIQKLINEKFDGNKSAFAKALGVERSHVSHILNSGGAGAGAHFFGRLLAYCEESNLDFREYIFLPNDVKKMTQNKSA